MLEDSDRPLLRVIPGNHEKPIEQRNRSGSFKKGDVGKVQIQRQVPCEYFKVVYELWTSGQTVDRESVSKVLKALNISVTSEDLDAMFELYDVVCTACES